MGLKKTLKKVAKVAKKLRLLQGCMLRLKWEDQEKETFKTELFWNSSAPGDANVASNIANWNAGMDRMGSFNEEGQAGLAYRAKGGLVKKGNLNQLKEVRK